MGATHLTYYTEVFLSELWETAHGFLSVKPRRPNLPTTTYRTLTAIPLKVATSRFSADCDGSTLVLALSGCPLVWGHPARDGLVQASRLVADPGLRGRVGGW